MESIVQTSAGKVRGISHGGIARFLGVPYAAAPVGDLRFAKPEPHAFWDDVRDATAPAPTAPYQVRDFPALDILPLVGSGWVRGDDYLNANIWTPDPAANGLPVMVFIHGGGFVGGSNSASVQDGSAFARSGVVNIAINYRMGIDGFLPIPGVPTNLGLRDQIAALHWVRENAAAFGGDPDNVTIFGESAGAMSIGDLVASPLAKGLFKRAIIQSGHASMTRDISVVQKLVVKIAKLLRVTPDAEGFRSTTFEACIKAVETASSPRFRVDLRNAEGREPIFGISKFAPVHGDDVLPVQPLEALKNGAGKEIEVLIGSNAEEMNLYFVPTGVREKVGKLLAWFILSRVQPNARRIFKAYGMGAPGAKPGAVFTSAMNDLVFRWPARRFAEEHQGRTHMYEFDWRSPALGGALGAAHGMELPFVFDTLDCVTGPQGIVGQAPPQELADRTHALWVGFARDGTLPWPAFDRETRQVYQLEQGCAVREEAMPAAPFLP